MDPVKIAIRALFAYGYLLAMMRVSGKRTISQGSAFDFVLALILGDMIDDVIWGDVPASQFVVGIAGIFLTDVGVSLGRLRPTGATAGGRKQQRLASGGP